MWQTLITSLVVIVAIFFIGRKLYRRLRQAIDPSRDVTCDCSCSDCSSICNTKKSNHHKS